ncbi:unnamed protein product, partial [Rotaria sp. Silwood1]
MVLSTTIPSQLLSDIEKKLHEQRDSRTSIFIIWLGQWIHEIIDNTTINKLQDIDTCHKYFNTVTSCIKCIEELGTKKKIILIADDNYARQALQSVDNLPQLRSVFVYCLDKNDDQRWSKSYKKIAAIKTDYQELIPHIVQEQKFHEDMENKTIMPTSIFKIANQPSQHDQSSMDINGDFIFFQSLIETLLRMSSTQDDLIEFLLNEYSAVPSHAEHIDKFRNDSEPNKALR